MAKQSDSVPCRLYALLAREALVGMVFRRCPSKWVQIVQWDTATDTFTPGQWFRGRIYERRCDLSPDGTLSVYFAMNQSTRHQQSDYTYAWTAVSRPPYLTALALWPKGDCWAGGGLFLSGREVWLNHREGAGEPHPDHRPQGLTVTLGGGGYGEDEPIQSRRLERDGWRHVQEWQGEFIQSAMQNAFQDRIREGKPSDLDWMLSLGDLDTDSRYVTHAPGIHEKPHPVQPLTLVMTTTLNGFQHQYRYAIRDAAGNEQELTKTEWADWDQQGRLVFTQTGKVFAVASDAIGQGPPEEKADLNGNKPEPIECPQWARVWPEK